MNKKDTALRQLINDLKTISSFIPNDEENGFYHGQYIGLNQAIEQAEKLLSVEKEEWIEASVSCNCHSSREEAERTFNETFNS